MGKLGGPSPPPRTSTAGLRTALALAARPDLGHQPAMAMVVLARHRPRGPRRHPRGKPASTRPTRPGRRHHQQPTTTQARLPEPHQPLRCRHRALINGTGPTLETCGTYTRCGTSNRPPGLAGGAHRRLPKRQEARGAGPAPPPHAWREAIQAWNITGSPAAPVEGHKSSFRNPAATRLTFLIMPTAAPHPARRRRLQLVPTRHSSPQKREASVYTGNSPEERARTKALQQEEHGAMATPTPKSNCLGPVATTVVERNTLPNGHGTRQKCVEHSLRHSAIHGAQGDPLPRNRNL